MFVFDKPVRAARSVLLEHEHGLKDEHGARAQNDFSSMSGALHGAAQSVLLEQRKRTPFTVTFTNVFTNLFYEHLDEQLYENPHVHLRCLCKR